MSPQRNFGGKGSQKFGARPAFGKGPRGPKGPKGKFFGGKPSGPQKKFTPKDEDSEDFSNESFDDSEASDLNETPDEGIEDQFMGKKADKRSLSFAKDVNTASSKKGPAQKTPMPSKLGVANGKPHLPNTPLGDEKKVVETKKPVKGKQVPSDDEDDVEDESEMGSEELDEMGSEEEEDSLMNVDEESEEEEDVDESVEDEDEEEPKPKRSDAKKANSKKKSEVKSAGTQLKVCGIPKNVAPEKLSSFFASKGFKNVQMEYSAPGGCFVATIGSTQEATKMKMDLKGAEFSKGVKVSLLNYEKPTAKPEAKKPADKAAKKKVDKEELSEEEISDEEMSGDEELDEMESFDEDEDEEESEEEAKEILKKANEAAKAAKAAVETKEKKPTKEAKEVPPKSESSELRAVIRGIAKSYEPSKIQSFLESKGVRVKGDVAWDKQASGFVVAVPTTTDLDKVQALRGSKLEKFSLVVSPTGDKKPEAPATKKAEKEAVPKPVENKTATTPEPTHEFHAALKGIPKSLSVDEISKFLQSKDVKTSGTIKYVQEASGFVVPLKSKADLDAIKNLKGEKIGGKFRFGIVDFVPKTPEAPKQPEKKKEEKKKPSKKVESAEEKKKPSMKVESAEEEVESEEDELNLGSGEEESVSEEEPSDEEESAEGEEEEEEDEEKEIQPKAKQVKKEEPPKPVEVKKGDEKPVTLRLAGIPKATPPDKLQDFFKQRGVPSAVVKLQDNKTLLVTVSNKTEGDKLRAMNGVRFNNFVLAIEEPKVSQPAETESPEKPQVPAGQQQFRARLLSIPSDFAVPKLTNLLKGRGVQTVVVTKENGQYIANCQTKLDFNRLLSLKGQRIDDKVRLMIAPMQPVDQKPQQQESRKRAADESGEEKKAANEVAAKKPRQLDAAQQRRQLYIGGIPLNATDDQIRKCFSECVGVSVVRRPGARRAFAFVTFDSEQTCDLVKNAKESAGGVKINNERVIVDFCGDKSSKYTAMQADKQKKVEPKQVEEKEVPKKTDKPVSEKPTKKGKEEPEALATVPKGKLKTKESPSKQDAKVRFADEDVSEEDVSDDDDDVDEEMDDEEMSDDEDEEMSFDGEGDDDEDADDDE